jgi:hypothetical protein
LDSDELKRRKTQAIGKKPDKSSGKKEIQNSEDDIDSA